MMEDSKIAFILIILAGIIGYLIAIDECKTSTDELNNLKIKYAQLNENYNQKVQENIALRIENEQLKSKQKQLTEEIASYLVEQTTIDLFGLKKYNVAYDLIKIVICNKNSAILLCQF
jgi:regulator of replication initiation timing